MYSSVYVTTSKSFQETAEVAKAVQQTLIMSLSANNYLPQQLQSQLYQLQQREAVLWGEFLSTAVPGDLPLDQLPMIPQQEPVADIPSVPQEDTESKAYAMSIPQQDSDPPTNNEQSIPQQDSAINADSQIPIQESLTTADTQSNSIPYQDYTSIPVTQGIPSPALSLLNTIPSIPQQDISQTATVGNETSLSFDTTNRPFVTLQTVHGSIPYTLIENSYLEININGHWFPGYLNFEDATHHYYLLGNEGTRYELTAGMKVRFFLAG